MKQVEHAVKNFKNCPFCSGKIRRQYSDLKDRFDTTKDTFSVSECFNCQAAFMNPMPIGDATRFYPDRYLSARGRSKIAVNKAFDFEKWYRYNQYKYDFKLLKQGSGITLGRAESFIDIGCGSGERVTFARDQGCKKSFGVDKFDFTKKQSKQSGTIINSEILTYKPQHKFQVASLFHVVEHIENPQEVLSHIRTHILANSGQLIVQVPNYESFERHVFGKRWFAFDAPRHLWHFNKQALTDMLVRAGYVVEAAYQTNAPLHPVSILPSINREFDIQRIWIKPMQNKWSKRFMTFFWAGLTILTIPMTLIENLFNRASMLTIIARNE